MVLLLTGCASLREVGHDNTVHLLSRPVSVTKEVAVRTHTFFGDHASGLWLRRVSFPLLKWRAVPEIESERRMMRRDEMAGWLRRKGVCATAGEIALLADGQSFFDEFDVVHRVRVYGRCMHIGGSIWGKFKRP